MKKTVLLYGLIGGLAIALLKVVEYRFLVIEHSIEIYGGLVALLFSALGIWLGLKLTRPKVVVQQAGFVLDEARLAELRITPRELEILTQIAAGMSNREIAAKLFVSENTVKTHAASVFDKLQAKRQAILAEIAGLKTKTTLPGNLLQQRHIDAFTKLLRAKLLESGAFAKEYLRLLVDEIRVNKQEVKLTGSYGAVATAVAGNLGNSHGVPRFAPNWLPD